jgi:hypothetical protein
MVDDGTHPPGADQPARANYLVQQLREFPANVLLFGMGGIAAHFPSKVESHYVSPYLPPGGDTFGEVLQEAHAHKIRVIGRFDFSKVAKPIYDAHPDWFFRKASLLLAERGKGKIAYIPWDVGGLYYRLSSPSHAGLVADLIDHLLPNGRQLKSNAHPLVEMTLMNQPKRNRTIVHLVNMSGHSGTAYFSPLPMRDIEVQVEGRFRQARSAGLNRTLSLTNAGTYIRFSLPQLEAYDAVVLER